MDHEDHGNLNFEKKDNSTTQQQSDINIFKPKTV